MKFVKMHGCGNDYVYLDGITNPAIARRIAEPDWSSLVQRMSDRHKGIGSDGVIVLCPPGNKMGGTGSSPASDVANPTAGVAHVRMRMFNADGSESEMCGNGIRCVAKFAHDRLNIHANPMLVETGRGVLSIAYETVGGRVTSATVDMGEPILDAERIPFDKSHVRATKRPHEWDMQVGKIPFSIIPVSMGNPHAVAIDAFGPSDGADPLDNLALWRPSWQGQFEAMGRKAETHLAFPNRVNFHFVKCTSRSSANLITWERGAGITKACGTGACAVLVAGVLTGRLDRSANIRVLGGELHIRWDEQSNHVFMTGPAEDICEGIWLGDRL